MCSSAREAIYCALKGRKQDWQRSLHIFTPFLNFASVRLAPQKPHLGASATLIKSAREAIVDTLRTLTLSSSAALLELVLLGVAVTLACGQSRARCPASPQR